MGTKLIKFDNVKNIMSFLQKPTVKIAEALTGVLASDLKDWKFSAGKIVQATIKGNLLTQLGRELKKYQEAGKIKEDYLESDANRASLKELLKFIDDEAPDELRFKAVKSIFLSSVEKNVTGPDELLMYDMLQLCKKLSSGEILMLKVIWGMGKKSGLSIANTSNNTKEWRKAVAKELGHNIEAIVEVHEQKLMETRMITSWQYEDKSAFEGTPSFRLTTLGLKFCELMTRYN